MEILASVDFDTTKFERNTGGVLTVLRTAIFDLWVRDFQAADPGGTVIVVQDSPGHYFFVADGVLAYLAQASRRSAASPSGALTRQDPGHDGAA